MHARTATTMSPLAPTRTPKRSKRRMRRSSSTSSKFPLPDNAFASVRLSPVQLFVHKQQIQQLIEKALDECDRSEVLGCRAYSDAWETIGAQDHVTAYWRQEVPTNSNTISPPSTTKSQYRVIGDVVGNYRDLMALHYAETSSDLFEWLQFLNHSTLDAHVIQTVESQSPHKPHRYFGVKWTVVQMSLLATKVDECFVEYMTYCTDRRGREVGVRVTLPVRIPDIDFRMDALKVRRMASQMVQILRPVDDKTTHMFVLVENDFMLAAPAAYVKTLLTQSRHLATAMDARRIRQRGLLAEKHWIPNASRRNCVVCTRAFGATRGRHHCRLCGDVTCRKCTVARDTAEPVTHKTFKIAKTKFCVLCVVNLRGRNVETGADAVNDTETGKGVVVHPLAAVDLTASTVFAVKASSSWKGRDVESPSTTDSELVDDFAQSAVWSDTESESWDVDVSDSARSSVSSSYSDSDPLDVGGFFGMPLQEIAERGEDLAVDERSSTASESSSPTSRPNSMVWCLPDDDQIDSVDFIETMHHHDTIDAVDYIETSSHSMDSNEGIETIDTKDMLRGHNYMMEEASESHSPLRGSNLFGSGVFDSFKSSFRRTRSRTDSATPTTMGGSGSRASARSIDQMLAEQEALLRQMAMAASCGPRQRRASEYDI